MNNFCSEKQAMVIGKIFTPFSINFTNWATKNLEKKLASKFVGRLLNKTLNPNYANYDRTKTLYDQCRKELEDLGFTEETRDKYSPFNV